MNNAGIQFTGGIRVIAALSVAALFIVIAMRVAPAPERPIVALKNRAVSSAMREYFDESDADADGLPDWLETLVGTDPRNPDTDGDGTLDGAEEYAAAIPLATLDAAQATTSPLADYVSGRILDEYGTLKEQNIFTPKQAELLGEKIAQEVRPPLAFSFYTERDLTIAVDSSQKAVDEHRKKLTGVWAPLVSMREPEYAMYGRLVETGDPRAREAMRDRAVVYKSVAEEMLAVPVPKNIAYAHLEIANTLSYFAAVLDEMALEAHDPFASLALLGTYTQSEALVKTAFDSLGKEYRVRLSINTNTP